MEVSIIAFCLFGAVFSNPILYNVILEQNGPDTNTTLSVSSSQSSESDTSELQSSEENTSNQSSKSESLESTSEDTTSEESDSQSFEEGMDSHGETRDNSLGSEENVRRQGWIHVYANVIKALSAEDNSSAETQSQTDHLESKPSLKHPPDNPSVTLGRAGNAPAESNSTLLLVAQGQAQDSGETSDSADPNDPADVTDSTAKSSESSSSESKETSEDTTSESSESNASDSTELKQIKSKDCSQGSDSTACESEEYFFQNIGDDGHHPADLLMVPDEDHRELSLRR